MDIASLAAKAELHALPAPLVPYLEPTTTTDRTPPNHYLHAGRKGRKVVGMSQASATGATVEPWADQTVSVSIKLTVSRQGALLFVCGSLSRCSLADYLYLYVHDCACIHTCMLGYMYVVQSYATLQLSKLATFVTT